MKRLMTCLLAVTLVAGAAAQGGADRVAGIQLYPGGSNADVEGSEKVIKDSGYKTAVCRHTRDSLTKVVAFYRNDKNLSLLGEPSQDNAGFVSNTGASMSINSPWMNMKTLKLVDGTMTCIVGK